MSHDITDPITIASVIVRDHLDTVISRHGQQKEDPVSAAVHKLATALLEHLPGETKALRNERQPIRDGSSVADSTGVATASTD